MASAGTTGSEGPVALATRAAEAPEPRGRAAQMEATRRALLDAARQLFAADGYQATRTEEVVRRAGVTRGALYHHFRDKEDLFRAVLEEVEAEVAATLQRRSADPSLSSWELFRINNERHLAAAALNPSYRQIALIDGPAVLGAREWADRQSATLSRIEAYLSRAIAEGSIIAVPTAPLAQMLTAIGSAASLTLAEAADSHAADQAIKQITNAMFSGLEVHEPSTT